MPYTFPMSYRRSKVHPKYDMVAVAFPSGTKLFGNCEHGINGAYCRSCQLPATFRWMERSKLNTLPNCAWCREPIIHFGPSPVSELWLDQNRFWQIGAPDPTHDGDRGAWYLTLPLHYACMMLGEPAFQVTDNDTTQHSHHDVDKEPDRLYYPEVADYLGRPEMEGLTPDDEQLEELHRDQIELNRYNSLCGPVTTKIDPNIIAKPVRCGNCKERHLNKYAVMACYKKGKAQ